MRRTFILTLSILCLLGSTGLAFGQWQRYQAALRLYPPGTTIAGVPVGGLDEQAAGLRLAQAYVIPPVELRAGAQRFQLTPAQAGFTLDLPGMLSEARAGQWTFLDYLASRARPAGSAVLRASLDAPRLEAYLRATIAPALEVPASAPRPAGPGQLTLVPGQPGQALDLAAAQAGVSAALLSLDQRVVELSSVPTPALPPRFDDLSLMLEAVMQSSGFTGAAEVYLQDLQTGQEIDLAYHQGRPAPVGIAFTAASTIKIPVLVSAFRRVDGELPAGLRQQMEEMIDLSDNGSTDEVMQSALNAANAPLQVTGDLRELGYQNTFLSGFFYPGAPLLDIVSTPANRRTDLTTDPDIYNQTTPAEIGRLLASIETCAARGAGPLVERFAGQVTQAECQLMVEMLKKNRKAVLIEAGLPEGTPLAHKYGWVTDFNDGLMHTVSDAAIIYTPGERFVLCIYLYDPDQLMWDPAQWLAARLAGAAYNFFEFQ